MKIKFKLLCALLFAIIVLASCSSKKKTVVRKSKPRVERQQPRKTSTPTVVVKETEEKVTRTVSPTSTDAVGDYIGMFAQDAMKEMQLYKIPASITLAQGILESGSGMGRLAVEANNHFGVKCHKGWNGGRIYHDDDASQECFRKYKDAAYSYRDHSLFLTERKRYSKLFDLDADDYKAWAKGLKAAGYATDRKYPNKLISLIERYRLDKFDAMVLGDAPAIEDTTGDYQENHRIKYTIVEGDTLYGLAKRHNTTVDRIKLINGLKGNSIGLGAVILIEPDTK